MCDSMGDLDIHYYPTWFYIKQGTTVPNYALDRTRARTAQTSHGYLKL